MIAFVIGIIIIALDQITKYLALSLKGQESIVLIEKLLELIYVENRGAAFGILQGKSVFFVLISLVVIAYLCYILIKHKNMDRIVNISLGLILGGAIGNLIDRIVRGFVVDFIFIRFWGFYDFPVFNVADIGVTLGVFILIILGLFTKRLDDF